MLSQKRGNLLRNLLHLIIRLRLQKIEEYARHPVQCTPAILQPFNGILKCRLRRVIRNGVNLCPCFLQRLPECRHIMSVPYLVELWCPVRTSGHLQQWIFVIHHLFPLCSGCEFTEFFTELPGSREQGILETEHILVGVRMNLMSKQQNSSCLRIFRYEVT